MSNEVVEHTLALASIAGIREVPESRRLATLPRFFGPRMYVQAESTIYNIASGMVRNYRGAYWHYYTRNSDALILVPSLGEPEDLFTITNLEEGTEYRMHADAIGISVCLFAYSQLSFWCDRFGVSQDTERFADLYHAVRDVACDHPQSQHILQLID
ncbi:antirestriction protein [Denitratimonas sp. CY0512]|uniref:antirestriction protein n=1 Tax=Denitratimonas sp. CY0512 TaxID=3131940 RepID=UPI0030B02087